MTLVPLGATVHHEFGLCDVLAPDHTFSSQFLRDPIITVDLVDWLPVAQFQRRSRGS